MRHFVTRRAAARLVFIIGFLFMFLGSAFLIGSLMRISRASILLSFLIIILGISCAGLATRLNRRSPYLFFAALFLQAGLFLFLHALGVIPIKMSQTWPLLSVFAGIALFPAGWHRFGIFKVHYIVPSAAFVILGSMLMVFALDLVSFSLAQFVRNWWPLLMVLAGLTLVLASLGTKHPRDRGDRA
ncbi:MAG: DUF5668 domain-containing protein [Treponema sp.]|jgi:hypothetical protein|nr:DUF5668 domain-containing protein [Treponema sp.]